MKFDRNTETAEIAGRTFKLKGYTAPNEKALIAADAELQEQADAGEISRHEYYAALLRVILDGPIEVITADVVEGRRAEEIIENFIPKSMRLAAALIGL